MAFKPDRTAELTAVAMGTAVLAFASDLAVGLQVAYPQSAAVLRGIVALGGAGFLAGILLPALWPSQDD